MTTTIGVLTPRAGQGSTTWALALAWELAGRADVLFIDADPQGGTAMDHLALDAAGSGRQAGMSRLFGPPLVTSEMLLANSVTVPGRPRLRVIPGLSGFCGPGVAVFLPRLQENRDGASVFGDAGRRRGTSMLTTIPVDFVITDLGAPLAHPDLQAPHRVAEVINSSFQRVFVVMRDDPSLLPHNLAVLVAANLPRAEVVLACRAGRHGRDRDMRRTVAQALQQNLPDLVLSAEWPWEADAAARAVAAAVAMPAPGLPRTLGLDAARREAPPGAAAREGAS